MHSPVIRQQVFNTLAAAVLLSLGFVGGMVDQAAALQAGPPGLSTDEVLMLRRSMISPTGAHADRQGAQTSPPEAAVNGPVTVPHGAQPKVFCGLNQRGRHPSSVKSHR